MTFTLVSAAREVLSHVVKSRLQLEEQAEDRRARAYEEVSLPESSPSSLCA